MEDNTSFISEISNIMRGFGDGRQPIMDSVELVEKVVKRQLKDIFNEAVNVSIKRKGKPNPCQLDFEFLMRKHPIRINRMRKHIKYIKLLTKHSARNFYDDQENNQISDEDCEMTINEKYDEEKVRRLFRADRISQILNGVQYQEYNEARRTSFCCRNSDKMSVKMKNFLNIPKDFRLSNSCRIILNYLIHENIATIVDYALLTRLNSDNRNTDPYSRVTSSGASFSMLHICPEVTQGRAMDGVKPITVNEIQEVLRRFNMISRPNLGSYRNSMINTKMPYLAI